MIIDKDSILYNLPKEFGIKDLLILDSIRFTLELINSNYSSLKQEIQNITDNHKDPPKTYHKDLIPLFNHCWGIIDNSQRLINLYNLLPSNNNHSLVKDILFIKGFRNTFQHIDERIEECLLELDMPFYGMISWEINLGRSNTMHKFFALSGLYISRGKLQYYIEKKDLPYNKLNNVTLQTFVKKGRKPNIEFKKTEINLSDFIENIKLIVNKFEKHLEQIGEDLNIAKTDWVKRRDIVLRFDF